MEVYLGIRERLRGSEEIEGNENTEGRLRKERRVRDKSTLGKMRIEGRVLVHERG